MNATTSDLLEKLQRCLQRRTMTERYTIDDPSINTRRRAEEIAKQARDEGYSVVDLSDVEFVSRSVADELVHQSDEYDLELAGLEGDVEKMVDAVRGNHPTP